MTKDVLARKLRRLQILLADLAEHRGKSVDQVVEDRYQIERILELLVQVSVDLVSHDLGERGTVPKSYRDAFVQAGGQGLLPAELAANLADAAGLRNVLVHLYEDIDYELVAASIGRALNDFARVVEIYERRLEEGAGD